MKDDEHIREDVLLFLYDKHQNARSMAKVALGIRDIQSGMKKNHGYSQQEVVRNLDYLIDVGWVKKEETEKEFTTARGVKVPQVTTKYKISASGIDYVQGPSKFEKATFANIKIKNIKGVVQVGNHNIVNADFRELDTNLEALQRKVLEAKNISDEDKLNVEVDIATIRNQLSKPAPERSIIKGLWNGIEKTVTAAGFAELCQKIAVLLGPFIG